MDAQLVKRISDYFATQPLLKAWVFGSYARGEEREDSDVDIMIVPDRNAHVGLFMLSGMRLDLQDILGIKVDLVTEKGLMPFARPSAEKDRILAYERVC
jgi:predicted nucleotidyltransferase